MSKLRLRIWLFLTYQLGTPPDSWSNRVIFVVCIAIGMAIMPDGVWWRQWLSSLVIGMTWKYVIL